MKKDHKVKILLFLILVFSLFLIFELKAISYGLILNYITKEFEGFAWGDRYLGFISSNCKNENECGTSNYKLMTDLKWEVAINVINLKDEWSYCDYDKSPVFKWQVIGGYQSKIQLQISTTDDSVFSSPVFDTGQIDWSYNQYPAYAKHWSGFSEKWTLPHPQYGLSYHWRLKVGDAEGNWSPWTYGGTFTLPPYKFPRTSFVWSPSSPSVGEEVQFNNLTRKLTPYDPEEKISFEWEIPGWGEDVECIESEACPCNEYPRCLGPRARFQEVASKEIKLKATHDLLKEAKLEDLHSGIGCGPGCCQIIKDFSVKYPLPGWQEVIPKP